MNVTQGSEKREIKNCFSVDVEGFVESNVQSFDVGDRYTSSSKEDYEIEKNVNVILELLDELNIKGTFFFLGRIARDIPHIVQESARYGHEIACHSDKHVRIFGMTEEKFKSDLTRAKKTLEDVSGKRVYGFRAPDFSITKSSLWALDILNDAGFIYDSSISPTGLHDVYGIGDVSPFVHTLENGLIEFPVPVIELSRMRLPFGGGGYFRSFPLTFTRYFTARMNSGGHPCMFYIHPYEVGPVIPVISELSYYRRFRHYYNCKNGHRRLRKFMQLFRFSTAIEILKKMNLVNGNI